MGLRSFRDLRAFALGSLGPGAPVHFMHGYWLVVIYIYIYIYRERERDTDTDMDIDIDIDRDRDIYINAWAKWAPKWAKAQH